MLEGIKKIFGGSKDEGAPKVEEKVEAAPETPVETAPAEETKAASAKPRIGYIHLSGCTGDAMSLTENYDILSTVLTEMVDIVYGQTLVDLWIHGTYAEEMPEMDLCLIEGSVCLQDEHSVHELLEARKKSGLICAFAPISSLVKVDCALPGCPVAPEMIAKTVVALCNGDMEYLQPAIDKAACNAGCGCDVLTGIIRQGLCSGCGTCALACPTRAMGFTEGRPSCDRDRCIKCGTCYTMCPRAWLPIKRIKEDTGL